MFARTYITQDYRSDLCSAYDKEENLGIQIYEGHSIAQVQVIDNSVACDWIFNCENLWTRQVKVGDYIVCDAINADIIPHIQNNVFIYTGTNWIYIENKVIYEIEVEKKSRKVWIGTEFTLQDMMDNTCLKNSLTEEAIKHLAITKPIKEVPIAYARCKASMALLDDKHRSYINEHKFGKGEVLVIKAGAGSGKTTTQLNLAKVHKKKRILYLAFNKGLVSDIQVKLNTSKIKNMETRTFDSLLNRVYTKIKGYSPNLTDLKPATITNLIPWFQGKSFKVKTFYCKAFSKFCSDTKHDKIEEFCTKVLGKKHPILEQLWALVLSESLTTFDSIRKECLMGHWFKQFIDDEYDLVFVDEVQDFDMAMLRMLLDDTTVPKLFVGDPRQAIYEWRGCINAFEYMPAQSLTVEFYSTFRIGEPALSQICSKFKDCYMISKAPTETHFSTLQDKYVYLFRSWRQLLTVARQTNHMWIYGFEQKINQMRSLHEKLQFSKNDDDIECEDDLPAFLRSLSREELDELICDIESHTVDKEQSKYIFYTVHSYKGLEEENIRIASDVDLKENENLYYVAITRAKKTIYMDHGSSTTTTPTTILNEMDTMDQFLNEISAKTITKSKPKSKQKAKSKATKTDTPSKVNLWSTEHDAKLLDAIQQGLPYSEIIDIVGRSELAIEFRLRKLGTDIVLKGGSIEEAVSLTSLSGPILEEAVEEVRAKEAATRKGARWDDDEINKILVSIRNGIKISNIAIACGRSVGSIRAKLNELAIKYAKQGFTSEEIIRITGLSIVEVNSAINNSNAT